MSRTVPDLPRITSDCVVAPLPLKLHAVTQLARRDAGAGEEAVLAADQVVGGQDLRRGRSRASRARPRSSSLRVHSRPRCWPSSALTAHAVDDALRGAADAVEHVDLGPLVPRREDGAGDVAVGDQLQAGADLADLALLRVLVAVAVEHHDREVADLAPFALATVSRFSAERTVEVDDAGRPRRPRRASPCRRTGPGRTSSPPGPRPGPRSSPGGPRRAAASRRSGRRRCRPAAGCRCRPTRR